MSESELFAFEDDFVASLRCIPMAVRLRLDRSLIKLTLRQWSRLTIEDRRALLDAPCSSAAEVERYRALLSAQVGLRCGESCRPLAEAPVPLWEARDRTPSAVADFARSVDVTPPSNGQWRGLSELQRFALLKLSRDNHDNVNFIPAMREFGLLSTAATTASDE